MEEPTQALSARQLAPPKRRMRSNAEKRRIVEQTFAAGASVATVARDHGVNTNLLFNWRRLHRHGLLDSCREPATAKLLPVRIDPEAGERASRSRAPAGEIEIELPGEVQVRLRGPVDRTALADVMSVLGVR